MSFSDPNIVTAPERYVAAVSDRFTMETRDKIPALWGKLWAHDFGLDGLNTSEAFGISYNVAADGFDYAAGFEIVDAQAQPNGGCIVTLAAGSYARFSERIEMARIPEFFDWIFATWLPGSGHAQAEGAVFEVYPADPEATETTRVVEVWVPIQT